MNMSNFTDVGQVNHIERPNISDVQKTSGVFDKRDGGPLHRTPGGPAPQKKINVTTHQGDNVNNRAH